MAENRESAGAVVYYLDKGPIFLLLKNTVKKTFWAFPKGEIEKGETPEQTAKREIKEETNLGVEIINKFRFEQRWFYQLEGKLIYKHAVFFLAKIKKEEAGKARISDEHEALGWFSYEEALKQLKIKQNREMLKKAYEFIIKKEKQKELF